MTSMSVAAPDHRERLPSASSNAVDCEAPALPPAVTGSKPLTRRLRQHLWAKTGHALLSLDGQPRLLLDFAHDQGVPLSANVAASPASMAHVLGEGFGRVVMQELPAERFEALAKHQFHQPLRPILWQIAQHGGDWDDLDRRLLRHARIRLLRWPDFRLISPLLGLFVSVNFSSLQAEAGGAVFTYGNFIMAVINFLLVALVLFMIIRSINRMSNLKKKEEKEEVTTKACPYCKNDIPLEAVRCPYCTSELTSEAQIR